VGLSLGGARFGPLRHRDFRALYTAHVVSVVGDGLVGVALAFAVLDLTGSAGDLGLVMGARLVPMIAFYLAGGVWGDRLPRHRLMVGSNVVRFLSQTAMGVLLIGGHGTIALLILLQAVHGGATAFYRPASSGIVPRLVERRDLQQANALIWGAVSVGGVLGPALSGVLVATVGAGWAILGDGLSFALAAWLLRRLGSYDLGTAPRGSSFWADLGAGWHEVRSRTWLWTSIVYFSVFQLVYIPTISVLGPLISKQSLGGPAAWALIVTSMGIGSILGNVLALRVRVPRPLAASYVLILVTVPGLVLFALPASALAIAAAEIAAGTGFGLAVAFWETTLQKGVPAESLSRVASYDWMGSTALRPVGLAIVGPIAAVLGVRTTVLAVAAAVVLSSGAILAVRDVRAQRDGETGSGSRDEPEAARKPAAVSA
jgi:MFS family permease